MVIVVRASIITAEMAYSAPVLAREKTIVSAMIYP